MLSNNSNINNEKKNKKTTKISSMKNEYKRKLDREEKIMIIRIIIATMIFIPINFINFESNSLKMMTFLIPYLIVAYDILLGAFKNIGKGHFLDEKFLMSIASLGAFFLAEYPEGVFVMLLYQIGETFQDIAVNNSKKEIKALLDIKADYAVVIRNNQKEMKVDPKELEIGETIVIRPGEKIPVDCKIIEGSTSLNTSALTGESLPQDKTVGDEIYSGSININGVIKAKTSKLFKNSEVSKILELVANSSAKKARAEKFITRFSKMYTPIVVFIALAVAILPPILLPIINGNTAVSSNLIWLEWIRRALMLLVISCPCALVISVPLSFIIGLGEFSKNGILVKGSNYIETFADLNTIVFDKTGTLTEGKFKVAEIHPNGISKEELLKIAATAENYSNHPIAKSIVAAYKDKDNLKQISNLQEYPGLGIEADVDGRTYFIGNEKLMDSLSVKYTKSKSPGTIVYISRNDISSGYLGYILVSDKIKATAENALKSIKSLGINKTIMLTGDSTTIAEDIANKLKLDEIHAQLLPADKVSMLEYYLKKSKQHLAFVGDGINDAAVLTRADVGIAMGAIGSDAAIEAADVVIMDDNLEKIPIAIKIAKKTMKKIKQNIIMSIGIKLLILILAVFGIANMWLAIFGDVGVLILAVINSIRK